MRGGALRRAAGRGGGHGNLPGWFFGGCERRTECLEVAFLPVLLILERCASAGSEPAAHGDLHQVVRGCLDREGRLHPFVFLQVSLSCGHRFYFFFVFPSGASVPDQFHFFVLYCVGICFCLGTNVDIPQSDWALFVNSGNFRTGKVRQIHKHKLFSTGLVPCIVTNLRCISARIYCFRSLLFSSRAGSSNMNHAMTLAALHFPFSFVDKAQSESFAI